MQRLLFRTVLGEIGGIILALARRSRARCLFAERIAIAIPALGIILNVLEGQLLVALLCGVIGLRVALA
jgi:hypothetical protein